MDKYIQVTVEPEQTKLLRNPNDDTYLFTVDDIDIDNICLKRDVDDIRFSDRLYAEKYGMSINDIVNTKSLHSCLKRNSFTFYYRINGCITFIVDPVIDKEGTYRIMVNTLKLQDVYTPVDLYSIISNIDTIIRDDTINDIIN